MNENYPKKYANPQNITQSPEQYRIEERESFEIKQRPSGTFRTKDHRNPRRSEKNFYLFIYFAFCSNCLFDTYAPDAVSYLINPRVIPKKGRELKQKYTHPILFL